MIDERVVGDTTDSAQQRDNTYRVLVVPFKPIIAHLTIENIINSEGGTTTTTTTTTIFVFYSRLGRLAKRKPKRIAAAAFKTGWMPFLSPKQERQSTRHVIMTIFYSDIFNQFFVNYNHRPAIKPISQL